MGRRMSGAVDRLPSGRWRGRFRGSTASATLPCSAPRLGLTAGWRASRSIEPGSWIDPWEGRRTFDYWAASWLSTTVHLKAKTRVGYESILRAHLMPGFGGRPVVRIDQPAVKAFFADMAALAPRRGPFAPPARSSGWFWPPRLGPRLLPPTLATE